MAPWRRLLSGGGALLGVALSAGVGLAQEAGKPAGAPQPPVPATAERTRQDIDHPPVSPAATAPAPPITAQVDAPPSPALAPPPLPRAKSEAPTQAAPAAESEGTATLSPPATVPPPPPLEGVTRSLVAPSVAAGRAPAPVATPAPDAPTPLATMQLPPTVPAPAGPAGPNAPSGTQNGSSPAPGAQTTQSAAQTAPTVPSATPAAPTVQSGTPAPPPGPAAPADVAGSEDAAPADPPADKLAFAPDAEVLIEMEIIPVLDRLADRALTLQNAVLRHCLVGHDITRDALEPAYIYAIEASAAMLPLSFGFQEAVIAPDRLLTNAVSTAFSTSKLEAVMHGEAPVPRTLAELAKEEAALSGLPALEILLMRRRYPSEVVLKNRCTLAVPVAANIVDTAMRARLRWLNREVASHWQGNEPDLAARLRLRDLIQGTIDTVDRVSRDLVAYQRLPKDKTAFRFTHARHGLVYLIAAAESLRSHVRRLHLFAEQDSGAAVLLGEIRDALTISCRRLLAIATGEKDDGAYLIAFEQAHGDIINELPQAFGFDGSAFTRALTSLDGPRDSNPGP